MFVIRLLVAVGVLAILAVLFYSRFSRATGPDVKPAEPRPSRTPSPPPPRYTLRSRPRDPAPGSNYEFDVLEGDRIVARYWHDFRCDEHGVTFNDGREVWLQGRVSDFTIGGGPDPIRFTPRAITWLETELGLHR